MVKLYYVAGGATAICILLLSLAITSTVYLLNDLSEFYQEAQNELGEFKDLATSTWDYMILDATPEELRDAEKLDARIKRGYDDPDAGESMNVYGRDPPKPTKAPPPGVEGYTAPHIGPPSHRPRKPVPPTMPRTIQGFRAATTTHNGYYDPNETSTTSSGPSKSPHGYYEAPSSTRRPEPLVTIKLPPGAYDIPSQPEPPVGYDDISHSTPGPRGPGFGPPKHGGEVENPYDSGVTENPRGPTGKYPEDEASQGNPKDSTTRPYPASSTQGYPEDEVPSTTQGYPEDPYPATPSSTQGYPEDEVPTTTQGYPTRSPQGPGFGPPRISNSCELCGQQPNNCPAGPPGPRGRPGPPGFPGQDGPRGLRGLNGALDTPQVTEEPEIGCVQCPIGPPGPPGLDGLAGPAGEDGMDGEQGDNGKDGAPGVPGAPGNAGPRGVSGRPGRPGVPGRKGQACRVEPGPPGQPGAAGTPGRDGDPGIDGQHGQDGSPGIQGPPGRDGATGPDGEQGKSVPGTPGEDAGYCMCPKRPPKFALGDRQDPSDRRRPYAPRGNNYGDEEYAPRRPQRPPPRPRDHATDIDKGRNLPYEYPAEPRGYGDELESGYQGRGEDTEYGGGPSRPRYEERPRRPQNYGDQDREDRRPERQRPSYDENEREDRPPPPPQRHHPEPPGFRKPKTTTQTPVPRGYEDISNSAPPPMPPPRKTPNRFQAAEWERNRDGERRREDNNNSPGYNFYTNKYYDKMLKL